MERESRKVREFRRREQEILDTALQLFLEQGEDVVTVEMIADTVGIGKAPFTSTSSQKPKFICV